MIDPSVITIKYPTDSLSYNPNIAPTGDLRKGYSILPNYQPILAPIHVPSSLTIFDPSHFLVSPPDIPRLRISLVPSFEPIHIPRSISGLFTFNVSPYIPRLRTSIDSSTNPSNYPCSIISETSSENSSVMTSLVIGCSLLKPSAIPLFSNY